MANYPVLTASRFCVLMLIAGLHSQVSWAAPQATATQAATVTQKAAAPAETQDETESAEADEDSLEYVRIRRNERRLAVALETSVIQFG